ncbi:MAG: porphobilinogen synthase, partial [Chthoniobacterales bacterium]
MKKFDLLRRMRRNRSSPAIRDLVRETSLHPQDFIQPLFVQAGGLPPEPVASMPGVFRFSISDLVDQCKLCRDAGIRAVAIFPKIDPALKDAVGAHAVAEDNLLFEAVRRVKAAVPDLLVITDVALDPYTDHGHDGVLEATGRGVANDLTIDALCELALAEAAAGADIVAPSDMMDGRVRAIREALDAGGFEHVA